MTHREGDITKFSRTRTRAHKALCERCKLNCEIDDWQRSKTNKKYIYKKNLQAKFRIFYSILHSANFFFSRERLFLFPIYVLI
jgi:hypothetical protein